MSHRRHAGPEPASIVPREQSAGEFAARWTPDQVRGDGGAGGEGAAFAAVAVRLAGLAGAVFGWRPGEFWDATPDELAALVGALVPEEAAPPDAGMIARLREAYPDG